MTAVKTKTTKWDLADSIDTKEDVIAHLSVAVAENDTAFLFEILRSLARAKGMTEIARELGKTREGLYKSIAPDGNPSFETVVKLLDILGLQLEIKRKPLSEFAA